MKMQINIAVRVLCIVCYHIHAASCMILRLPCMADAKFNVIEHGKRLTSNIISKHYDTTDVQCTIFCVQNLKCRSYNINKAKLVCELTGKALVDNGTKLENNMEWLYKSTNYSSLWVGPLCREKKPCEEGTLCRDSCSPPFYECVYCDEHHSGLHCDMKRDKCKGAPCKNGGECINEKNIYACHCKPGYTGRNCEIDINECDSLPCFNGGTCDDSIAEFACACPPGFTGIHCEADINECDSIPCLNGGTCNDSIAEYTCTCLLGYSGIHCEAAMHSCLDWYHKGKRQNAIYDIFDQSNTLQKVLCDFDSEADSVWTLITSFSLQNKNYFNRPFFIDSPRNENSPNWMDYRLGLQRMTDIRASSTIWRATCNFQTNKSGIYHDYVRAQLFNINILNYDDSGKCFEVDRINIRGHEGRNITVAFWQNSNMALHTDSHFPNDCAFDARSGSAYDEDNFGLYSTVNSQFICTKSPESTTQYWLGGRT